MTQNNDLYVYLIASRKKVSGEHRVWMANFQKEHVEEAMKIFADTHLDGDEVFLESLSAPVKVPPEYYIDGDGYLRCRIGNRADL